MANFHSRIIFQNPRSEVMEIGGARGWAGIEG